MRLLSSDFFLDFMILISGNFAYSMYRQNGSSADSGALFLAVSKEESASNSHTISPNGYDLGRCVVRDSNFLCAERMHDH